MNLKFLGWYGRANAGDDAFVDAFAELFPDAARTFRRPGAGLIDVSSEDVVILGGGDVVKPYYLSRIDRRTPFYVIGCGLGYEQEIETLAGRPIRGALFRNQSDVDIARRAGLAADYAPDLCFVLPPRQRSGAGGKRKRLGVILSGHPTSGTDQASPRDTAYFEYFQWELASVLDDLSQYYDVTWLSLSTDPDAWDEGVHYSVRRKMIRRDRQRFIPYEDATPRASMDAIASMDLVLTMKFHGAIFATIQGTPFVSIGLTRKLDEFCVQSGLSDLRIPAFEFSKRRALETVKAAEAPGVRERLLDIAARNGELVKARVSELGVGTVR